ncbi:hypothetical protein D3C72_151940 [compost metagenome]
MSTALPATLSTPRLLLRAPRIEDAAHIFDSYAQNARVSRYLVWKPSVSLKETTAFIEACIAARSHGVRMPYVLTLHGAEDTPLGMLDVKISQQPHSIEIGYVLAQSHWGHGYMPEAVSIFSETVLKMPAFFRVHAYCDVDNIASARTLEKSGFSREGRAERHTLHPNISAEPRPCYLYARCK